MRVGHENKFCKDDQGKKGERRKKEEMSFRRCKESFVAVAFCQETSWRHDYQADIK